MNFYEQLFCRGRTTGEGMTHFERLFAAKFGGSPPPEVREYTGAVPVTITADGTPLLDYLISGNMSQTGTPSPDNPIQPSECGDRTGNLFDKDSNTINNNGQIRPGVDVPAGIYSISNGTLNWVYYRVGVQGTTRQISAGSNAENINASDTLYVWRDANIRQDGVMLNTGSTALPYEPWGYKIPISSASTTTPVYLGEVESTRRIKKLVLDGTEDWRIYTYISNTYRLSISNAQSIGNPAICSHFVNSPISSITSGKFTVDSMWIYIRYEDVADLAGFKAYLATQYANGTPVTVWYVLAEPTTGIVNEPIRKIGDYADTLSMEQAGVQIPTNNGSTTVDVETTLKPSEVYIKYMGYIYG